MSEHIQLGDVPRQRLTYAIEKFYVVRNVESGKLANDLYCDKDVAVSECDWMNSLTIYRNVYDWTEVYAVRVSDKEAVVIANAGDKRAVQGLS
jgi:hypothetical protein